MKTRRTAGVFATVCREGDASSEARREGKGVTNAQIVTLDQLLVERAQRGDRAAFDRLTLKYQHRLASALYSYVGDHSEVMDIVQEAFLRAYRALPQFQGNSAFYTWLYRIGVNAAQNYTQSRQFRIRGCLSLDESELEWHGQFVNEATPDESTTDEELGTAFRRTLRWIPEPLRTALELRELRGLSYKHIAQLTEAPLGTVRSRIRRARVALAEHVEELGGDA